MTIISSKPWLLAVGISLFGFNSIMLICLSLNPETVNQSAQPEIHEAGDLVNAMVISRDGERLFCGCFDGSIRQVDVTSGRITKWQTLNSGISTMALSYDGSLLVSAGTMGEIQLWDATTGHLLLSFKGHTQWVKSLVFTRADHLLSGGSENQVKEWRVKSQGRIGIENKKEVEVGNGEIIAIYSHKNNSSIAASQLDGTINILNSSFATLFSLNGYERSIRALAFSSEGDELYSGGIDGTLTKWDMSGRKVAAKMVGHQSAVLSIAIADKQIVASGSADKTARIWNKSTGEMIHILKHAGFVTSLVFVPNQNVLISGTCNNDIVFWNVESGKKLKECHLQP